MCSPSHEPRGGILYTYICSVFVRFRHTRSVTSRLPTSNSRLLANRDSWKRALESRTNTERARGSLSNARSQLARLAGSHLSSSSKGWLLGFWPIACAKSERSKTECTRFVFERSVRVSASYPVVRSWLAHLARSKLSSSNIWLLAKRTFENRTNIERVHESASG